MISRLFCVGCAARPHRLYATEAAIVESKRTKGRPSYSKSSAEVSAPSDEVLRAALTVAALKLGVTQLSDWYGVRLNRLLKEPVLSSWSSSQHELFKRAFPEHNWKHFLFGKVAKKFWDQPENRREYMDWLFEQKGYQKMEDWYNITHVDLKSRGGSFLLTLYEESVLSVLMAVYPHHTWIPWKFKYVSHGFWDKMANQRAFLAAFAEEHRVHQMEQWYTLSHDVIKKSRLGSLITVKYGAFPLAIMAIYSEHPWQPWRFTRLPFSWWSELKHRKEYFEWLGNQLGIKSPQHWLHVTAQQVHSNGGGSLLYRFYGNSIRKAVLDVFRDADWTQYGLNPSDVANPPLVKQRLRDPVRQRDLLDSIGKKLGLTSVDDWYSVTNEQVRANGGSSLIKRFGQSLQSTLMHVYSEHQWQPNKFCRQSRAS